jgi:membrane protease YdiL (CAAX protease family)
LSVARRFPLAVFFGVAFGLSIIALLVIGLPRLSSAAPSTTSLVMFPIMVIGVGLTGIALTAVVDGRQGISDLRGRTTRWRLGSWYLTLLVPPLAMLLVLATLSLTVSPRFAPGFLIFGLAAGLFAGFCEELGWTGFAFPRMRAQLGGLGAALLLGVLWGLWHLPVVDSLGAASPHGRYWAEFFLAFASLLVPIRVMICWLYVQTGSILLTQLFHASFTGSVVLFSPPHVAAAQEAGWYLAYAFVLWLVVLVILIKEGPGLGRVAHKH